MKRTAKCSCGELIIKVNGKPKLVATCSCQQCQQCQRRTGSVFGVSSYFDDGDILEIAGKSSCFKRSSDSGRNIEAYFCPSCGSTVYWKADFLQGQTGIAVGCFEDADFPEPTATVWNETKHSWVSFPESWLSSENQEFNRS